MVFRSPKTNMACVALCAALCISLPASGLAAGPRKPARAAAKPVPTDAAYEQWLKKYGAYDRIVAPAEDADDATGASVLKRAEGLLLQGSPQQALAILENQQAYAEPAAEIQRLWLGGQAHRALGDPFKAVIWFSYAAKLMPQQQVKASLTAEPGLEPLWVDVFRRQFWGFAGNPAAPRETMEATLRTLLDQAVTAWGQENFWVKSREALALATGEMQPAPAKPAKDKDLPLLVGPADQLRIAQALCAASLDDQDRAQSALSELSHPALKDFWTALVVFMRTGKPHDSKTLAASGYAKASGFWSANLLAPYAANRDDWYLGSNSQAAWVKFRTSVLKAPAQESREAVDKELQSLLLSEEMGRLLRSLKLILHIQDGNMDAARDSWAALDKRKLPVTLRLAGAILFPADVKELLPQEPVAAAKLAPVLQGLLSAAGAAAPLPAEAPFWTRAEVGRSSTVNKVWPLDRLLVLADWQARWSASPGQDLARRSAFLFPDTAFGYECLTHLTQKAVEERRFQLATTYLARMADLPIDKSQQAIRLGLKAKMERDSGRDSEALETYRAIVALGVELSPKTRLDMATFLQIKNDYAEARKHLLLLWEQRDALPRALQAEVLFWLGEGEHSQRNYDEALDHYLRLAFQYPQEGMWTTAALYRAAMIYEIKGKFETAKKFLNTVMNTAERKEEREAARNRLNALEAKSGRPAGKDSADTVYPF